ncbi:lectin PVL [Coprinopsis sp. MPI-PUGE-AT-0042]|nr:lectin PVL [Coprinopsis sp. MPI-PUGE-AT-0042]
MSNPGPKILSDEQRARNASTPPCIIGFGMDGVLVSSPRFTWLGPMNTSTVLDSMAYNTGGWRPDIHPRMLADTTGDGRKDLVGFGNGGVWIARNSGNYTFGKIGFVLEDFGYNSGWRHDQHIRLLSDLRGTGRADIVGFGHAGVLVSLNLGEGSYAPVKTGLAAFGTKQGWALDKHPRYLADLTGNGLPDIIGFGESHTYIARNKGDGTFHDAQCSPNLDEFCFLYGWRVAMHPRHLVDLTGDGRADIIGFKNDGVFVSLNDGQGNFGPISFAVHDFGTCQGWQVDRHPRFVVPLTDKQAADIIGFGEAGVYVSMNKGDGTFERSKLVLGEFGFQHGWRTDKHMRFLVDLTGDGCPDIVGFGEDAIWVSFNTGQGTFGSAQRLDSEFTVSKGWTCDKTLRFVSVL